MGKKILVIGGSYFAGRVFAIMSSRETDFALTLINRGRYSMSTLPNVREYVCDRHDAEKLRTLPKEHYDAVVDFCAYSGEDVRTLLTSLPCSFDKYILLSTADVYQRTGTGARNEDTPLLTSQPLGAEGEYLWGKLLAETCAAEICAEKGVLLTVLRPSFIFGPYNYAPRESYYIEKIVRRQPIPLPVDADSRFSCVYVKDAALAVIACINSPEGGVYNLAAPETLDYAAFIGTLCRVCDMPSEVMPVTIEEAMQAGYTLPFPLTPAEEELFDGSRICAELGFRYTPFAEAMQKTYLSTKPVFLD